MVSKTLRSSLCSQNVSFLVKVEGASIKTNWKNSYSAEKKRTVLGKQTFDILKQKKVLKNLTVPKIVKEEPLGLGYPTCCKISNKMKGDSLEKLKKFRKIRK